VTFIFGCWEVSKAWIISGTEGWCSAINSVLINQGKEYHAALEKGHKNNICISSCRLPHLEQFSLICFEYLLALLPVGSAFLSSLQAKVWTLGAICLSRQTWLRRDTTCGGTILGICLCGSWRLLKQCLYALLEENWYVGVSFQIKVSSPLASMMGVWRMALAVSVLNREFIKFFSKFYA
jgi:hypothetical protein